MATQAGRLFQDQNLNVHYNGASVGGKTTSFKAPPKKGGLGVRKALNDISNSGNPSGLQASKKHSSANVISIGEELGAFKTKVSVEGKTNVLKAPEKVQVGGRKALSDLTNSGKPSVHQLSKKSHIKKLNAVVEENYLPSAVAEERFLHDHQKCIKARRNTVDMDTFLKIVGLDNDISVHLASPQALPVSRDSKRESPLKHLKMEEISELLIEDRFPQCRNTDLPNENNNSPPPCQTSKSPRPQIEWEDYNFSDFMLMGTP
ncbi:unnamed protein product [Ilex paraguariensis]|uniref:Uncharacterized protein n=1 Tax=Ilex paraguariensis TaxID=185542 RepID=A0ABC8U5X9_9AQUA